MPEPTRAAALSDPLLPTLVPASAPVPAASTAPAAAEPVPPRTGSNNANEPTLIPAPHSSASPETELLPPMPVGPSATAFDEETRRLLYYRLYAVHGAVCVVLAGLISMNMLNDSILPVEVGLDWMTRQSFGFVFVECAAAALYLWRRPGSSIRTLRRFELTLFLLGALVASMVRYRVFTTPHLLETHTHHHADLVFRYGAAVTNMPFLFLILLYGVLIPNTRRRSLVVVITLAVTPMLVTTVAAAQNESLRPTLRVILPTTAMNVFMAGVIAVVSAARTQTLRREAYDARREARQVGAYVLRRKLGEGGMGEVYLAEHKLLKRPCAVKFIRPEYAASLANARRFEREVRAMTALSHFNTVRVYDYGRADNGAFYYVMEYLDGLTLDAMVREAGPLEPARAVHLLRQVCGALAEAHSAGLVHRDLKPGNILVAALGGQQDVAKLLDFGLVHDQSASDGLTQTGAVLGTPAFMSPEQACGEGSADPRVDVYSLGAVAFFALTGRPPFEGATLGKLLAAHLTQRPPLLNDLRPDAPSDLALVVDRCLSKSPADRFATVKELEAALTACACAGEWTTALATTWWKSRKPVQTSGD